MIFEKFQINYEILFLIFEIMTSLIFGKIFLSKQMLKYFTWEYFQKRDDKDKLWALYPNTIAGLFGN
jgi:hypothetical protein